jgi:hypothetical protein
MVLGHLAQAGELAAVRLGEQPPSPSHCEGWLQICLKRIR